MKIRLDKLIYLSPIFIFFISLSVGSYYIPIKKVIDILTYKLIGYTVFNNILDANSMTILLDVRLPRTILSILIGSALSVSGASFQAILRNPLVDPYILGLSSGAAFGAALSMSFIDLPVQVSAFIFAFISVSVCCFISKKNGQSSITALILAGVVVSSIFTALFYIVQIMVDPLKLRGMVFWVMGGFHTSNWHKVFTTTPYIVVGLFTIYILRWKLNVLSLGEEEALSLGINPEKDKFIIIVAATILASASVAAAGIISLVGIMIPHILRMIFGPDNRKLIPLSICLGGAYLAVVDNISRNLFSFEIPIGIFTTLLGAPFFILLLRKVKVGGWD